MYTLKMTTGKLREFIYENYCIVNGLDLQKENLIIHGKKTEKTRFNFICNEINNKSILS